MKYFTVSLLMLYAILCAVAGYIGDGVLYDSVVSICLIFAGFAIARQLFILYRAVCESRRNKQKHAYKKSIDEELLPAITVIVPAYNEEAVITHALQSMQKLDYPNYKVIVIDDGSTDKTHEIANQIAMQSNGLITVVSQPNSGKSQALNCGIRIAESPFVLCVDADSTIRPDSLRHAIVHLNRSQVAAVAGFVDIDKNQRGLIPNLQRFEYLLTQKLTRAALSSFKSIPIVPGPAGLFRRDAIIAVGGYKDNANCFAEDAELSLRLLASGWNIVAENKMVAITQAPKDLNTLLRQRYRWFRGSIQALLNNLDKLLLQPSRRGLWLFAYLLLEIVLLPTVGVGIALFFLFDTIVSGQFSLLLVGLLVLISLELIGLFFVIPRKRDFFKYFLQFVAYRLSYGYLLLFWAFFCLIDEILSITMSWDKLDRYEVNAK